MASALSRSVSRRLVSQRAFGTVAQTKPASGARILSNSKVTQLANGIRVATEPSFGETASIGVFVDAGSRHESDSNNGVAHFLEHMFMKGTGRRDRLSLEKEVENMGGRLNAYTNREHTVFTAQVLKQNVPQAVDLLSDIIQNSELREDEIEREKETIVRESKVIDGSMDEVVLDRLHYTAYRNNALGRSIIGSEANVRAMNKQTLKDFIATHYTGNRIVITGSGAVDRDSLVNLAKQHFSNIPSQPTNGKAPFVEPAVFTGSDVRVRFDDMPEAHVAYAFPVAGANDADNVPLMVMQELLGSYTQGATRGAQFSTSDMVKSAVENGQISSIRPFLTQYSDTGLFGLYASASGYALNDLMYIMSREMTTLCFNVEEADLQQAKDGLKSKILGSIDGSKQIAENLGFNLLRHGRVIHPSELLARIDAVDSKAIKSTANRYFYDRDFALAAVGPTWELPDYNWIRRRTYWVRF